MADDLDGLISFLPLALALYLTRRHWNFDELQGGQILLVLGEVGLSLMYGVFLFREHLFARMALGVVGVAQAIATPIGSCVGVLIVDGIRRLLWRLWRKSKNTPNPHR